MQLSVWGWDFPNLVSLSETVLPLVCSVGIIGNLIAVLVLISPLMRWVLMEYQIHHKYNTKIVTINTVQTFFQDYYISSESAISRGLRHFVSYHDVHG